ncbi:16S rRNA (cytosine(967)-C(5))-methyltransferase RsmB [Thermoclostridium stercorarium]|nr:16S rRNA (cytosine(967)-C(5))-methyltransferase RsmB [Thermoclostridium stercorarium]UZQ85003.1 16S rRNA (cytosine(967)-C(5))-methyltransferase RsmB [Thermoclostridium stercorarium]
MDKARETALKAIYETDIKGAYANLELKKLLADKELNSRDRAFITELVYGTVTRKLTLDWIISHFSKIQLKKMSNLVLQILRMGTYQIMFLDRVPPSAACNTSVELAKRYAKQSSGFVNAVLRNIARNKERISFEDIDAPTVSEKLSIKYSFPEYLVREWISVFGENFTEELLKAFLERPDFSVRINTLKTTKESVVEDLNSHGIETLPGRYLDEALYLKNISDISNLDAFQKGKITVQDESSMIVARILDPKPGEKILDTCAAPGGKTTHIGQLMQNRGHIDAWDVHEHKIALINENAKRLGVEIINASQQDALYLLNEAKGVYDRVLVDAPCSGTGIIRRKPDIKWKRKKEDLSNLVEIQKKILYNAGRYVKPGGVLVYSTCSVDVRENEEVVKFF